MATCKHCGAALQSLTAICPYCGYDLSTEEGISSVNEFIKNVNTYDAAIQAEPETRKGWRSWHFGKKLLWILLNLFTSFVPLAVYLLIPRIQPLLYGKTESSLTQNEKNKASLIKSARFPNERAATIEAMLFVKAKLAFLASEKVNKKTLYWANLWHTKAQQLHQRADIIMNHDKAAEDTFAEINANKTTITRHVMRRAVVGSALFVLYLVFILANGSLLGAVGNVMERFTDISSLSGMKRLEWLDTGLSTKIPEMKSKRGNIYTNSETELWIDLRGVSYKEFESYVTECKDEGYTVNVTKDTNTFYAFNDEGYLLKVSCYGSSCTIQLKAPLSGDPDFTWPNDALAAILPVLGEKTGTIEDRNETTIKFNLYDVTAAEYKKYVTDCQANGFTVDSKHEEYEDAYRAFNEDGYELLLSLSEMKVMSITLNAPKKMTAIKWPTHGPATLVPTPSFEIGEIVDSNDWSFSAYIRMTPEAYDAYVDECIESGFKKESYRRKYYFSADKSKNISLDVEYVGYNTVYIRIYDFR